MHEIEFREWKVKRQLPGEWNELTLPQLLTLIRANLLVDSASKEYKPMLRQALRRYRLKILLKLPEWRMDLINDVQVLELHRFLSFLDGNGKKGLTRQLLPSVKAGLTRLHGPRERFRNITFLEFIFADSFFMAYTKRQTPELLDKFIACLYREKAWFHVIRKRLPSYSGDCRQAFNQHLVEERAKTVAKFPQEVKVAILLWYRSCREELEKDYPLVFTEGNQVKASRNGWDKVLINMSKEPIHLEATGRALIRNILAIMQERAEQVQEAERKSNHENKRI